MRPMVRLFHVDAFTAARYSGNPATVVLGAEALDEADVQALARELGHGDSVFALPPDATGARSRTESGTCIVRC